MGFFTDRVEVQLVEESLELIVTRPSGREDREPFGLGFATQF